MPVPEIEALDKASSDAQAKAAISSCIATEIKAGRDPDQAKAMCYEMVRSKTSKELAPKEGGS